jgi:hypothetical protein
MWNWNGCYRKTVLREEGETRKEESHVDHKKTSI